MLNSETIWKKVMTKKTRRRYTAEFKAAAVARLDEPGETLSQLTVSGLPRIIRMASLFLAPQVGRYLDREPAVRLVELLSRLVISYFLAPSTHVDLGDPEERPVHEGHGVGRRRLLDERKCLLLVLIVDVLPEPAREMRARSSELDPRDEVDVRLGCVPDVHG